jgi:uncharacterized peroxidase-related enzyme
MASQRLKALDPKDAHGKTKALVQKIQAQFGSVPNIFRTLANSSSVLEGHGNWMASLGKGKLDAKLREKIALTVAQINGCPYCLSAHTAIANGLGLNAEEIANSRQAKSTDVWEEKVLQFSRTLVEKAGKVSDSDLENLRSEKIGDEIILEILFNTVFHIFNNYLNAVARTQLDFPPALDLPQYQA